MKTVFRFAFLLFFTLALAGIAGVAQAQQAAPAASGPVVQVPETSFNFGEVNDGADYVHDFKIKNVGNAALEIKKVLPS